MQCEDHKVTLANLDNNKQVRPGVSLGMHVIP